MSELNLGQIKGLTVNNNVVTVPSGHTLYAPGHVVQVVSNTYSVETSMNTTSFTSSGLTATITPKFASSKILVIVSSNVQADTANIEVGCTIFRGTTAGTNLGGSAGLTISYPGAYANIRFPVTINTLDSPNTTSAVTYTYAVRKITNVNCIVYSQAGSPSATMTLLEIAA